MTTPPPLAPGPTAPILVGVDLSAASRVAIGHAVALSRRTGAEVVLALVDGTIEPPAGLGAAHAELATAHAARVRDRLAADRRELAALAAQWADRGVALRERAVEGDPDVRLPELAAEVGAGLIVVGSHGRSRPLGRLLFGSVADRVTRAADRDVMVARMTPPSDGYHHVVVGTDFTPHAARALHRALALAAPDATVDVVHCWQLSPLAAVAALRAPTAPGETGLRAQLVSGFESSGAALLRQVAVPPGVRVAFHVRDAAAAHGLEELVRDAHADLVVVGSHGHRGWRRFTLGSVSAAVARDVPCTALVVR